MPLQIVTGLICYQVLKKVSCFIHKQFGLKSFLDQVGLAVTRSKSSLLLLRSEQLLRYDKLTCTGCRHLLISPFLEVSCLLVVLVFLEWTVVLQVQQSSSIKIGCLRMLAIQNKFYTYPCKTWRAIVIFYILSERKALRGCCLY